MRCLPLLATCAALAIANRLSAQRASTPPAKKPVPQPISTGAWDVSESKSEMTDEHTVALSLRASAPLQNDFGAVWPTLVVRCRENRIEAYVNAKMVLDGDSDGDSRVRLRWNEDSPIEATWSRSSDYQAVFADDPAALLVGLSRYSKFRIEVHPYDRTPVVASFAPRGVEPLIPKLTRACPKAGLDTAMTRARADTLKS